MAQQCDAVAQLVDMIIMILYIRTLDLRSTGHGFKSYSGQKLRNNFGQVVHTYVPPSPSSITWYGPTGGDEGKVTAGLPESTAGWMICLYTGISSGPNAR